MFDKELNARHLVTIRPTRLVAYPPYSGMAITSATVRSLSSNHQINYGLLLLAFSFILSMHVVIRVV